MTSYLTKRDEWAGDFRFLFDELDEPRTDTPVTIEGPPCHFSAKNSPQQKLSELHQESMDVIHLVSRTPHYPKRSEIKTNKEGGEFVTLKMMEHKANVLSQERCQSEYEVWLKCWLPLSDDFDKANKKCDDLYTEYDVCWCKQFPDNDACHSEVSRNS